MNQQPAKPTTADANPSANPSANPGALLLQSSLHETIWGGRSLAELAGKTLPPNTLIGESWETADDSIVRSGPHTGQTLAALVQRFGLALIGHRAHAIYGQRFPLLTKFIDAREQLSVQVHPNDAYAAAHEGGKLGKTEAWYILRADPGATLVYGLAHPLTPQQARDAIAHNTLERHLRIFPVTPGDVIFVPAGTIHAIGAGVALYELQEYSDITYRLYDYGRLQNGKPRELHIERGLDVMRFTPPATERVQPIPLADPALPGERRILVACAYFVIEELHFSGHGHGQTTPASAQILTLLEGDLTLHTADATLTLHTGDTTVLPATLGPYRLTGSSARLLRAYVPEPTDAALATWRAAQPIPVEEPTR